MRSCHAVGQCLELRGADEISSEAVECHGFETLILRHHTVRQCRWHAANVEAPAPFAQWRHGARRGRKTVWLYCSPHRREVISPYSTDLADAKWEPVADLFKRTPRQRSRPQSPPPQHTAAALSSIRTPACCACRLLHETFPLCRHPARRFRAGLAQVHFLHSSASQAQFASIHYSFLSLVNKKIPDSWTPTIGDIPGSRPMLL